MSPPARPTIVIVGRPNVGKSTLFNRITGSRRAIVGDESGITRDRIRLEGSFRGRRFDLIDTGGMLFGEPDEFPTLINDQVQAAHRMPPRRSCLSSTAAPKSPATDRELADFLRRTGKPVIPRRQQVRYAEARDARRRLLRTRHLRRIPVVGRAWPERRRNARSRHPRTSPPRRTSCRGRELIQVAIIGRPNVGKSDAAQSTDGAEAFHRFAPRRGRRGTPWTKTSSAARADVPVRRHRRHPPQGQNHPHGREA